MSLKHVVEQGECLSKIAQRYGFRDYQTVYNHGENAAFRAKRPDPNIIFPGDEISIPDKMVKTLSAGTGRRHIYRIRNPRRILRLRVLDSEGKPLANEPVEIAVAGKPRAGLSTDGAGRLELPVEVAAAGAKLKTRDQEFDLKFSHLNPVRQTPDKGISGIQARLRNLGYYDGPITQTLDRPTRVALTIFQHDAGLGIDGQPNPATMQKLMEAHGC